MRSVVAVAVICIAGAALPLRAHHSHGQYEDTFMDLEGVVKEVHLVVPHSWIYLEVKDRKGGEPQVWAIEATGRTGLLKAGITADMVKPGDAVKARCHHLRDGSNGCLLGFLKAKDGTVKDWDGGNAPAPPGF
ncbi:MAG: DUF6152 family protein [Acidobacteriota bacterium]